MHLYDKAVCACGRRRDRHRRDKFGNPVLWLGSIITGRWERLSAPELRRGPAYCGLRFQMSESPLTKDDIWIPAGHNILRAHQQLLQGAGKPAFEQDRLPCVAKLFKSSKFCMFRAPTWITSTSSNRCSWERSIISVTMGSPVSFLASSSREILVPKPLERVRGGARFERAAPEHGRPGGFYASGNFANLLFGFYRTGPCDNLEIPASELHAANVDNSVLRVELPVRVFIGLLDPFDILHNIQRFLKVDIQRRGISDQAEDGLMDAFTEVDFNAGSFPAISSGCQAVRGLGFSFNSTIIGTASFSSGNRPAGSSNGFLSIAGPPACSISLDTGFRCTPIKSSAVVSLRSWNLLRFLPLSAGIHKHPVCSETRIALPKKIKAKLK